MDLGEFFLQCELEILRAVDTMRFPNDEVVRLRLHTFVKQKLRELERKRLEVFQEDLRASDEDERQEDELFGALVEDEKDPLSELIKQDVLLRSLDEFLKTLERLNFRDEAEYVKKLVGKKGRISKYEKKKIKGSVAFLILSLRRKRDGEEGAF